MVAGSLGLAAAVAGTADGDAASGLGESPPPPLGRQAEEAAARMTATDTINRREVDHHDDRLRMARLPCE
jgi:hypothetical protein